MRTTGIAELKAKLSQYLAFVREGEEILVTDRGRPVARLAPAGQVETQDAWIAELARKGQVRLPTRTIDLDWLKSQRLRDPNGVALASLLAEREEGW